MADGFGALIHDTVALAAGLTTDLRASVTIAPRTGRSRAGVPTYGGGVVWTAFVKTKTKQIIGETNAAITVHGPIVILADAPVKLTDKLTLPNGTVGIIRAVDKAYDAQFQAYTTRVWIGFDGQ
jgi:hypothetical protein